MAAVTWQLRQEVDLATRKRHSSLSRAAAAVEAFRVNFLALFMSTISQTVELMSAGSEGEWSRGYSLQVVEFLIYLFLICFTPPSALCCPLIVRPHWQFYNSINWQASVAALSVLANHGER